MTSGEPKPGWGGDRAGWWIVTAALELQPPLETRLLDAYGVAPAPDRTRYYRLLYDLGP